MRTRVRTASRPETPSMAREWEKTKVRYLRSGLCHRCAAQAAWGHQYGAGGWNAVRPPCSACSELIAMFAYPTINPVWRSVIRKRL